MANNNLASIPEFWAREGLAVLTENTPAAMRVNRQYSADLASYGDTVNAYRAGTRKIRRKDDNDNFTAADASLTAVPVVLDQWFYDSFVIKDGEMSKSIADLRRTHLVPVIQGIARGIDRAILGRVHNFLNYGSPTLRAGKLRGMTSSNSDDFILEAQEVLHTNRAPGGLKTAIVHQTAQTFLQGNELFAAADKRGSAATLTTGLVGQIYGLDVVMSQDVNYCYAASADVQASTTTEPRAAGFAGAHAITDPGTDPIVGEYFIFEENGQPTYITATSAATDVTLNEALKYAITDNSVATHYLKCANEAVTRAAGYHKEMLFTHTSGKNLQVGQILSFGTTTRYNYTIIEATNASATTTSVLLDRPLDAQVASGANAFPGPAGGMNVVFDRDAIALVTRPLAIPGNEFGVMSAVQEYEGVGLRVTMQYDSEVGGMRVNVDCLAGVSILNSALLVPLLS